MSEKVHVIEVLKPQGRTLVGPWYADKAVAKSWVRFVKSAYHGMPTRVRSFSRRYAQKIQDNGGQLPKERKDGGE